MTDEADEMSFFDEAELLVRQVFNEETDTPLRNIGAGLVSATLAVAEELRRLNDRGDRFNQVMLEFFERITEEPSPGPSGAGATAQGDETQ